LAITSAAAGARIAGLSVGQEPPDFPKKEVAVARHRRLLQGNVVYHVFNRRTDKQCLFASATAYADFLKVLQRGKARFAIRLHGYCLMRTHWHLAASAEDPRTLSGFLRWVSATHAVRLRFLTETRGHGHVYQDRYKARPVETSIEYLRLVRYIEANPVEARVVERAEHYEWSSLRERTSGRSELIEPGPWELPAAWLEIVNSQSFHAELEASLLGQPSTFRPALQAFPKAT
jgi:putative transposase